MFPGILIKPLRLTAVSLVATISFVLSIAAQQAANNVHKSQEVSEVDGVPVLIKHLPDADNVRPQATFAKSVGELKAVLGDRPVLDQIEFVAGTEAVTASYPAGKLLIVEYTSPQQSVEADQKFTSTIGDDPAMAYRRIGNYNVIVFDAVDKAAAEALIDQVKYEKQVQWLGNNPFRISAERAFVITTTDMFISTALIIVLGAVISIFGGLVAGLIYFQFRERQRSHMAAFSDAGGMTRLNLDGFTPDIMPDRLLGE